LWTGLKAPVGVMKMALDKAMEEASGQKA
jgi:hypothetical protein